MIKLTEFTTVVDTYKKNFTIRSKRFAAKKKKDSADKKEQREARIEGKKFFGKVGEKASNIIGGSNLLDSLIRFTAFTLLGVIVKNLDKIALIAKNAIEKIKQYAIQFKKYFDDVLVPLFNDIVDLGGKIRDTFINISDFIIDMNPYRELSDVLATVMSGILALGYRIAGRQRPFTKRTSVKPTLPGTKAKPGPRKAAKQLLKKSFKPSRFQVRAAERAKAAERAALKKLQPTPVGASTGSGAPGRGMPVDEINRAIDDTIKGKDPKIKITKKQYSRVAGPKQFIPDTPTQLLGRAIGSDIANLINTYKKLGLSNSDLLKIANDIDGESFNERKAAYEILKKKGLADRVFNVPDASEALPKPVNRTPQGILRGPGFRAPTIPPAQQPLTIIQKFQRTLDINSKRLQKLTKGLDFRFDAKGVIKNQILNPKNLLTNIKNFGVGMGIDVSLRFLGKYLSSILPYNEDFEYLAYLGMIDPDRIHQLTATKILKLPQKKRDEALAKLLRDTKSTDDIIGAGQRKREMATAILNYISIFSKGSIGKPQIESDVELEKLEFPEHFTPKSLIDKPDPTQIPKIKRADEDNYDSGGNKIKIGDPVGYDISRGLNSSTTYGSQGVMISKEVVIAIQPVEVPA